MARELPLTKFCRNYRFPSYKREEKSNADYAYEALMRGVGRTLSDLPRIACKHIFKDLGRAAECRLELINQIGGWSSVSSAVAGKVKGFHYCV